MPAQDLTRIVPLTGTETNRAAKAASVLAGEIHSTSDQKRVFLQNELIAPVWHGTVANEAARLAISSTRGVWPGDEVYQTDTDSIYRVITAPGTSAGHWVKTGVRTAITDVTTTNGDLIIRAAGALARLAVGTDGQFLKVVSGLPAWATLSALTDPTTTNGDIIIRAAGVLARLGIGSDGQVLKVVSGAPAWAAESGGGGGAVDIRDVWLMG